MTLALTTQVAHHKLRTKQVYINAQASGSYTSGGDTVDLTKLSGGVVAPSDNTIGYPGNIKDYGVISAPAGFSANLVKGSALTNWALQVFETAAASPAGVALSLGTLSAAATNSTYTSAGLVTVLTATPPPLGAFVVHSNGASAKGIFLNGVIVQVTGVVAGTSYTFNFGQGVALAYASAADTLKWQQVQVSASNVLQSLALPTLITGVLATANLLTVTQTLTAAQAAALPGQFVYLNGPFKAASVYALGAIVQVATASTTGWTANWQGTIIAQTSAEVGVASVLVTNGNAPITTAPYVSGPTAAITNVVEVASDASHAGLFTLTAGQNYQAGQIFAVQGVVTASAMNGSIATVIASSLTSATIKANGWGAAVSTAADTGQAALLVTGSFTSSTGELSAAPYPAAALVAPFVIMVEGPKGQL